MFKDDLNIYSCEKILGKAKVEELNNCTQYFWDDYKICNKYEGTLSLLYSNKQDDWSSNPDRNSYSFSGLFNVMTKNINIFLKI